MRGFRESFGVTFPTLSRLRLILLCSGLAFLSLEVIKAAAKEADSS
jgi:hypothetical protein